MSKYGFREHGLRIGLSNLVLLTTMKVLRVKSFTVRYKNETK